MQPDYYTYGDLHSFYQGVIAEHIVRQELLAINLLNNKKYTFWVREKKQSNAEIDNLVQFNNNVIPVEIKSGKTGTLKSLHQFMNQTNHPYALRFYAGDLKITDATTTAGKPYKLLNLPYFLAGKTFDYLEWFVKKRNRSTMRL